MPHRKSNHTLRHKLHYPSIKMMKIRTELLFKRCLHGFLGYLASSLGTFTAIWLIEFLKS
jgi:hypothetical protein